MTSTGFSIGLNENLRASSKVLKPPGGGSSDIFGTDNMVATPRGVRNNHASNIFSAPAVAVKNNGAGETPRRNGNSADSHNRLFGDDGRSSAPIKNHQQSSIVFGGENHNGAGLTEDNCHGTNGYTNGNGTNGHTNGNGNTNGNENTNGNGNNITHSQRNNSNGSVNKEFDDCLDSSRSASSISSKEILTNDSINSTSVNSSPCKEDKKFIENLSSNRNANTFSGSFSANTNFLTPLNNKKNLQSPRSPRNPVTGEGINAPSSGRQKKMSYRRVGNPVTGDGYSAQINTTVPSLNSGSQQTKSGRVPPGGYSSGLW